MQCYYFGTFDPVHIGHIKVAEAVKEKYGFDKVIFVPTPKSPFKDGQSDISDRINMLEKVLRKSEISDIELNIEPPNYTYKTIEKLGNAYFILGYDQFLTIENWKKAEFLKEKLFFIVIPRAGACEKEFNKLKEAGYKFEILKDFELVDVSSSKIRENARLGKPLAGLVHKKVEEYINEKRLYNWNS